MKKCFLVMLVSLFMLSQSAICGSPKKAGSVVPMGDIIIPIKRDIIIPIKRSIIIPIKRDIIIPIKRDSTTSDLTK